MTGQPADSPRAASPAVDDRRTARLLGLPEAGALPRRLRARRIPAAPVRVFETFAEKRGWLRYGRRWLDAVHGAQRAVGTPVGGGPRFLVRADEFPIATGYDDERFGYATSVAFHDVMAAAGLPYLMAVVPQWTHAPLDPDARGGRPLDARDRELLDRMRADGVTFGQHGETHRTRAASPRRHSELSGLDSCALAELLDRGGARWPRRGARSASSCPRSIASSPRSGRCWPRATTWSPAVRRA